MGSADILQYMCIKSTCCTPEAYTTLYVNHNSMMLKKKHSLFIVYLLHIEHITRHSKDILDVISTTLESRCYYF